MSQYVPNGGGLENFGRGFSVHDGTGYAIWRSPFGCQTVWPGYYADNFDRVLPDLGGSRYDASPQGTPWVFLVTSGSGMYADSGFMKARGNNDMAYCNCPTVPELDTSVNNGFQSARLSFFSADSPLFLASPAVVCGGPAVYCFITASGATYHYWASCANGRTGGANSVVKVYRRNNSNLQALTADVTVAASAPFPQGEVKITAEIESATHSDDVRVKVYLAGSEIISVLDDDATRRLVPSVITSGIYTKLRFGMLSDDHGQWSQFYGTYTP